jgi:ribosomal protein S12 methylthiotransferase accessory factor
LAPTDSSSTESGSQGITSVLGIDLRPDATKRLLVREPGKRVEYVRSLPAAGARRSIDVVVGVYEVSAPDSATALARWARAAGVPALAVAVHGAGAFVGPLTIPGRVGCAVCAYERLLAAAGEWTEGAGTDDPDVTQQVCAAITRELETIASSGVAASPLVDHVLSVETHDVSRHRVVPLPRCGACGGAAMLASELSGDDRLAGWVDPVTGVIPAIFVDEPLNDAGVLPVVVTAAPPRVVGEDGSLRRLPAGWGKGLTVDDAILSAVGEAVERYSASLPDPERIVWKRPDQLAGDRLDPRELALYGDAQYARPGFPYARFDPDVQHPWVRGRLLESGAGVWVPAVLVYLSLTLCAEHLICQGTSNGLAASTDEDDAALRAVLELVERDALMTAWLTRTGGIRIAIDGSLDSALRGVLDGLEHAGVEVELYVLPTSVCGTTAICLALGDGVAMPAVAIGVAADLDASRAVRGAILELGQTTPYLRRLMRTGEVPIPRDAEAVRQMLDHAAFYFPAERASAFDALRAASETVPLAAVAEAAAERSLRACASSLAVAGVRVAVVDVTSPDVATSPFRVVRAVSPDLQPICYGYGLDRLPVAHIRPALAADAVPPIHPIW